jgi:hypothetical protein
VCDDDSSARVSSERFRHLEDGRKVQPGTSFQSIVWMLIFDIVTIKRNDAVLQRYENNHCITTTKLLWRCFRIMSIIGSFGSIVATMGSGFSVDVLIGYALKKVIKIVAVIVGLFLAGLAYLQYHQVANIN